MTFIPQVGSDLTVVLPGEVLRCPVVRMIDDDTVIVELTQPFSRTHQYRAGDKVACQRKMADIGGEEWRAVDERLLAIQAATERAEREAADRAAQQRKTKRRKRA